MIQSGDAGSVHHGEEPVIRGLPPEARMETLLGHVSDVLLIVDTQADIVWASPSVERYSGFRPDELDGLAAFDFVHPADLEAAAEALGEVLRGEDVEPLLIRLRRRDGTWRWQEFTGSKVTKGDFGLDGALLSVREVHDRVEADEALRASEARLVAVLTNSADVAVIVLPDDTIEYVSPAVTSLLGYTADELIGADAVGLVHPDDLGELEARLEESRDRGGALDPVTVRIKAKFGAWIPVEAVGSELVDPDGRAEATVVSLRDVRWRQEAEKLLRRSEERFRALVQNSSDAVVVMDGDGKITYASPAIERVFGHLVEERLGRVGMDFVHPDDRLEVARVTADLMARPGASNKHEFRLIDGQGNPRWVEVTSVNLLEDPAVEGIVSNARDISERKELEARLMHAASHDSLTGLTNRPLLMDRLKLALARSQRSRGVTAVLFVDLDGFKPINDRLGHRGGDRVLVVLAHRLQVALRPGDTVARWGGDEFVVVCEDLADRAEVLGIAERVRAAITGTLEIDGAEVVVGACVGVALAGAGSDPDSLIREADAALYRAKQQGTGRVEIADRPRLAEFP